MVFDHLVAHFEFFFMYCFWRIARWFCLWVQPELAWKLDWWPHIPWRRPRNWVWCEWLILVLWGSWSYLVYRLLDRTCCRIDGFHSLHQVLIRISRLVGPCCSQILARASVSSLINTRVCPGHGGRLCPAERQWMLGSYWVLVILIIWIEFRIGYFIK